MEAFFAGLIGFLIGRGIPRKDAETIVKALQEYLGFEPPLGLTGYALEDMTKGEKYNASVVVRGKTYDVIALEDIGKHSAISVLGKSGGYIEVAPELATPTSAQQYKMLTLNPGQTLYDTKQEAAGELLIAIFNVVGFGNASDLNPLISCDEKSVLPLIRDFTSWHDFHVSQSTPGIALGVWDTTNEHYSLVVTVPYPFQKSLKIGYKNFGTVPRNGYVSYAYKKTR